MIPRLTDNKIRTAIRFINEKEWPDKVRILELRNPDLFAPFYEFHITNGLGYEPVRKAVRESKVHTMEGLRAHLANMEWVTEARRGILEERISTEHLAAIVSLDKAYAKLRGEYIQLAIGEVEFCISIRELIGKLRKNDDRMERVLTPGGDRIDRDSEPRTKLEEPISSTASEPKRRHWYDPLFSGIRSILNYQ